MSARFATSEEIENWNNHILSNPDGGNIFSSFEYAEQKRLNGYTPRYVVVDSVAVTVVEKSTPPLGKLWYLPKGPNVANENQLLSVLSELEPLARKNNVFVIRVESELPRETEASLKKSGLIKAQHIIPNPSTITLDISKGLNEIIESLPQKGRHAIRRAERDGVTVGLVESTDENCKIMYDLLSETAKGQFGIRSYEYYRTFWQRFEAAELGQLFFAFYEGKVVAGAYAMTLGSKSTYKDGASVRDRTAYGASHLLQWKVIEWAKSRGVKVHDFCGSPPSDQIANKDHPHYGVGRFKLSFSKQVVDYIGCYDKVLSQRKYSLWLKGFERLYKGLYYRITKDYYY